MKLTTALLLLAGSFCLYQTASAGVQSLPLDLLQSLKIDDENVEIPVEIAEDEIHEQAVFVEPLPEVRANECQVTIRGGLTTTAQPIFLKAGTAEYYPYNELGVMQANAGANMEIFCPKEFTLFAKTLLTATCVSGSTFRVDGNTYDIKEFVCKSWPTFVAQKTNVACEQGTMIRTGFEISSTRFLTQMNICFNEQEEVTRYVKHALTPGSNYYQTGIDRITFTTGGFFGGKNVDKLYTQVSHQEVINNELGGSADKYFNTANIFLARGHMGAKADFVYGTEQRGSFLFLNAAPQWQIFNAGNWERIEDGVRSYVTKNKLNVMCYTGVWGVTTLPNNQGVETPLYLDYDNNHNGLIPVPKIYFRVVMDTATQRGIVFVGVNNPHLTQAQIEKDYILCPDVGDKVTYVNWKKDDILTGYSYACTVEEFRKKVTHLPALSAPGGLLL